MDIAASPNSSTKPSSTTARTRRRTRSIEWWHWYAPYLHARQHGSTPEEAASAAEAYMERLGDAPSA